MIQLEGKNIFVKILSLHNFNCRKIFELMNYLIYFTYTLIFPIVQV